MASIKTFVVGIDAIWSAEEAAAVVFLLPDGGIKAEDEDVVAAITNSSIMQ